MENIKFANEQEINQPKKAIELLADFHETEQPSIGEKIKFGMVGGKTVYNPSAPFDFKGKTYMAARVESQEREDDSEAWFFTQENNKQIWMPIKNTPVFKNLQDPSIAPIDDNLILSGVETFPKPMEKYPDALGYKTVIFQGKNINNFNRLPIEIEGEKDIKFLKLSRGRFAGKTLVASRPEKEIDLGNGDKECEKNIAYLILDSFQDLTQDKIKNAKIIKGLFAQGEWGGIDGLRELSGDNIGALAHIAHKDKDDKRHYYSGYFEFNLQTGQINLPLKIIATMDNFPPGPAKQLPNRPKNDLKDVVFCGGVYKNELYCGLSDFETGKIRVKKYGTS